jgi:hypothetical protein
MTTAGELRIGDIVLGVDGRRGDVIDIVRSDSDPHHVGVVLVTPDGVSMPLFDVNAPLHVLTEWR